MKEEKLDLYDTRKLKRAKEMVKEVFEYNYKPSGTLSHKLGTVLRKMDQIIEENGKTE